MSVLQDFRLAFRVLVKNRWMTIAAATALALGIGANTTVFTLVNAVLIRGLPFEDPASIMSIGTRDARDRERGLSYLDYLDWQDANRTFSGLSAYGGGTMNVSDAGLAPERYSGSYVSANAFGVLGQRPILGRDFRPEDDRPGAPAVVVLGHAVWTNRYGADPSIVGRTIRVNDVPSTVIGVMPEGFQFPFNNDVWQPMASMPGLLEQKRDLRGLQIVGRLAPDVTTAQAIDELTTIARRLGEQYPATNKDIRPSVMPWHERVNGGPIRLIFLSMMGAVGFVLLIACANVANLLLARAAQRSPEIAVRVSLGATRWQIVRQLLLESLLLAFLGGIVGLALAAVGIRLFDIATADPALGRPYWIAFTMDWRVLVYLVLVCAATAIIFGLAPALHVSKVNVNEMLKEGGRSGMGGTRARRWTSALLVVELALTLVLLAGAGFMVRSFLTLYRLDLGIDTSRLTTMRLALPDRKYSTPEQRMAFFDRLQDRLTAPSMPPATMASNFPMGGGAPRLLAIDGKPAETGVALPTVTSVLVGRNYFEVMRLPVRGRALSANDGAPGQEAAVINQRFATLHFPNEDPIGRRITLTNENAPDWTPRVATIVGVSPTVRQSGPQQRDPDAVVYLPYRADPLPFTVLLVQGQNTPALTTQLREAVRELDADLPLFNVRTMDEQLAAARWPYRIFGTMLTIFAVIALVLSGVGLYAVTAYSVTQRTQEIGVRLVLGAEPAAIRWMILKQGVIKVAIGLTIGLAGAFGVGQLLSSLLVQMSTSDPMTLVSIAVVLVAVSLGACLWPARRATRLDPVVALRWE